MDDDPRNYLDPACPVDWSHPLARGLVGWWMVGPNPGWRGGATLRDLVRGGKKANDGTLTNGTSWRGSDRPGGRGHLQFDGVDDYVALASNPFDAASAWSIAAWVKYTGTARRIYFSKGDHGTATYFGLEVNHFEGGAGTWGLRSAGALCLFYAAGLAPGAWLHLAATLPAAGAGSAGKQYVNGSLVTSTVPPGGNHAASEATTLSRLGARDVSGAVSLPLAGLLDDVRVYSRVLSAGEARALYDNSRLGCPGLLSRLDDAPGGRRRAAGLIQTRRRALA